MWLVPDSCQLSGLSVLSPSQSQSEGKHSPVFVSCYLPPHVMKSICMTCFDALRDPDGVTIVSICPIVTRIDRIVVIFTPHMSVAWCGQSEHRMPGCRGQGLLSESPCHAPVLLCSWLQHNTDSPTSGHKLNIGWRHGESRDVSCIWLPVTWPIWLVTRRQKRCFHLRIYVSS